MMNELFETKAKEDQEKENMSISKKEENEIVLESHSLNHEENMKNFNGISEDVVKEDVETINDASISQTNGDAEDDVEQEPKLDDEWLDIIGNGTFMKKILKNGNGNDTKPKRNSTVKLKYKIWLSDDTLVSECENEIILGDNDVISGLDMAVALMETGEISEIIIPSKLAYGTYGKPPTIPGDVDLKLHVELVAVMETPDEDALSFDERMKKGEEKRVNGNFWFKSGEFTQAIQCYRRALDFLDSDSKNLTGPEDELQQLLDARLKVYNNMAAAQIKINAYEAAFKSLEIVLKVQPNNVKALFRKGKVLADLGKIDEAIKILKSAVKIEPEEKIIHQELSKLVKLKRKETNNEREMFRKMLGQDKIEESNSSLKFDYWSWGLGVFGAISVVALSYVAAKHYF